MIVALLLATAAGLGYLTKYGTVPFPRFVGDLASPGDKVTITAAAATKDGYNSSGNVDLYIITVGPPFDKDKIYGQVSGVVATTNGIPRQMDVPGGAIVADRSDVTAVQKPDGTTY